MERRTAFVAGATGKLGPAICRALASDGLALAVHAHSNASAATRVVDELAGDHLAVSGELASADGPSAPVRAALEHFGRVDVLVNAAHPPLGAIAPVGELDLAEFEAQLAGVLAHAALCRDVLPSMRANGDGRIVLVAGALMRRPAPGFAAYGAAKAAATTLTRYVALEEGRHGVTANIVAPGRVVDPDRPTQLTPEQQALTADLERRLALGAFPTPDDVAHAVASLVRPEGRAVTGQTIWITGGEPID